MFIKCFAFAVENLESLLSLIYGYLFETVWIMLGKCGLKKWTMGFVLVFLFLVEEAPTEAAKGNRFYLKRGRSSQWSLIWYYT